MGLRCWWDLKACFFIVVHCIERGTLLGIEEGRDACFQWHAFRATVKSDGTDVEPDEGGVREEGPAIQPGQAFQGIQSRL